MTNLKHRKGKPLTSIPTAPLRAAKSVQDFKDEIYAMMSKDSHWLVDEIMDAEATFDRDDHDFYLCMEAVLFSRPELRDISIVDPMLEPIMSHPKVSNELKEVVKRAKEVLKRSITVFTTDYPEGYSL